MKKNLIKILIVCQILLIVAFIILMMIDDEEIQVIGIDCWAFALLIEALNRRSFGKDKIGVLLAESVMLESSIFVLYALEMIPFGLAIALILAGVVMLAKEILCLDKIEPVMEDPRKINWQLIGKKALYVLQFGAIFLLLLNVILNYSAMNIIGLIGAYSAMVLMFGVGLWKLIRSTR